MAYYAYKQVRDLLPQHIIDAQGPDYEGAADYDGDQWVAAADYIVELREQNETQRYEIQALEEKVAELRCKRVALSDEQIDRLGKAIGNGTLRNFARAIERAHGIGEAL